MFGSKFVMKKSSKIVFIMSLALYGANAFSFIDTGFYKPYDVNLKLSDPYKSNWRVGLNFEHGSSSECRDFDENRVNVLSMYNKTESSLAMFLNPVDEALAKQINGLGFNLGALADDGIRGHFKFSGDYSETDVNLWTKYAFNLNSIPGNFNFHCFIPFKKKEISNVRWDDQTRNVLNSDRYVKDNITENLDKIIGDLGDLDIRSCNQSGLGDIEFVLDWFYDFAQEKETLKNVRLNAFLGLFLPTGKGKDENKVFSVPMGNDGAYGIPLGMGITLNWVTNFKGGLDVNLLILLDKIKDRRIKTHEAQTDFLFLNKTRTTKDFGLEWKFNLFLEYARLFKGLSARIAYQFVKHDDDTLTAKSDDYIYNVINSAESLREWSVHSLLLKLDYDFWNKGESSKWKPQFSLFYKMPFMGKRSVAVDTFGFQLALNF